MCTRKLVPGEQFGLSAGKLFCKMDFDALPPEAGSSPGMGPTVALPSYGVGSGVVWLSASWHTWLVRVGGAWAT